MERDTLNPSNQMDTGIRNLSSSIGRASFKLSQIIRYFEANTHKLFQ